ncbi:FAD/NAD(P)-binding domain-containing protein [Daedalea quercina L-15889]|uniref:FAD/NAD(P)-binding domain-containing protein n=1 Tax=Daedalea quercina L-15889 TaxID=1314783 RepID=A0A165LBG8_9APHY|nr:FAD/NAD(P)-binding domain-containing protein [Daedalea quercina L-15889]
MAPPTSARIGIIGAGAAGLITAHTLLRDGFCNVEVLTRDETPGGVWAAERVYPGLSINNVHGKFRFSPLQMPPPANATATGGRLSGEDMTAYMESLLKIRPSGNHTDTWAVTEVENIIFDKLVLCTGGCSEPKIPEELAPERAKLAGSTRPVLHSSQFRAKLDDAIRAGGIDKILVVGGGKSAQDISAQLARRNIPVSMVLTTTDAVLATPIPYPAIIRKSKYIRLPPSMQFSTEIRILGSCRRFLHTSWLGATLVHALWTFLTWASFWVLAVPSNSPLRNAPSLFWTVRTNDEGTGSKDGFHALVNAEKIELIATSRAVGHAADGQSILLDHGRSVRAGAVILATGYTSSWDGIFDASEETMNDIGLGRHCVSESSITCRGDWSYTTLTKLSSTSFKDDQRAPSLYRGIIPAKNILRKNLAVNGAIFTTNNGYVFEVTAHWISSYFLGDGFLRLSSSTEEAVAWTDQNAAWLRKRYPDTLTYANESYSADVAFWSWPQLTDGLLADMQLPTMRSGGNVFTLPFKVIDLNEIKHFREERAAIRADSASSAH